METAVLLALLEQYGPTLVGLALKYGPDLWRLVQASEAAGTLQDDVRALVGVARSAATLLGGLSSLADLAPVDNGNPTPDQDRLARPTKMGGR